MVDPIINPNGCFGDCKVPDQAGGPAPAQAPAAEPSLGNGSVDLEQVQRDQAAAPELSTRRTRATADRTPPTLAGNPFSNGHDPMASRVPSMEFKLDLRAGATTTNFGYGETKDFNYNPYDLSRPPTELDYRNWGEKLRMGHTLTSRVRTVLASTPFEDKLAWAALASGIGVATFSIHESNAARDEADIKLARKVVLESVLGKKAAKHGFMPGELLDALNAGDIERVAMLTQGIDSEHEQAVERRLRQEQVDQQAIKALDIFADKHLGTELDSKTKESFPSYGLNREQIEQLQAKLGEAERNSEVMKGLTPGERALLEKLQDFDTGLDADSPTESVDALLDKDMAAAAHKALELLKKEQEKVLKEQLDQAEQDPKKLEELNESLEKLNQSLGVVKLFEAIKPETAAKLRTLQGQWESYQELLEGNPDKGIEGHIPRSETLPGAGIKDIPLTDANLTAIGEYFDFRIRQLKEADSLTPKETEELKKLEAAKEDGGHLAQLKDLYEIRNEFSSADPEKKEQLRARAEKIQRGLESSIFATEGYFNTGEGALKEFNDAEEARESAGGKPANKVPPIAGNDFYTKEYRELVAAREKYNEAREKAEEALSKDIVGALKSELRERIDKDLEKDIPDDEQREKAVDAAMSGRFNHGLGPLIDSNVELMLNNTLGLPSEPRNSETLQINIEAATGDRKKALQAELDALRQTELAANQTRADNGLLVIELATKDSFREHVLQNIHDELKVVLAGENLAEPTRSQEERNDISARLASFIRNPELLDERREALERAKEQASGKRRADIETELKALEDLRDRLIDKDTGERTNIGRILGVGETTTYLDVVRRVAAIDTTPIRGKDGNLIREPGTNLTIPKQEATKAGIILLGELEVLNIVKKDEETKDHFVTMAGIRAVGEGQIKALKEAGLVSGDIKLNYGTHVFLSELEKGKISFSDADLQKAMQMVRGISPGAIEGSSMSDLQVVKAALQNYANRPGLDADQKANVERLVDYVDARSEAAKSTRYSSELFVSELKEGKIDFKTDEGLNQAKEKVLGVYNQCAQDHDGRNLGEVRKQLLIHANQVDQEGKPVLSAEEKARVEKLVNYIDDLAVQPIEDARNLQVLDEHVEQLQKNPMKLIEIANETGVSEEDLIRAFDKRAVEEAQVLEKKPKLYSQIIQEGRQKIENAAQQAEKRLASEIDEIGIELAAAKKAAETDAAKLAEIGRLVKLREEKYNEIKEINSQAQRDLIPYNQISEHIGNVAAANLHDQMQKADATEETLAAGIRAYAKSGIDIATIQSSYEKTQGKSFEAALREKFKEKGSQAVARIIHLAGRDLTEERLVQVRQELLKSPQAAMTAMSSMSAEQQRALIAADKLMHGDDSMQSYAAKQIEGLQGKAASDPAAAEKIRQLQLVQDAASGLNPTRDVAALNGVLHSDPKVKEVLQKEARIRHSYQLWAEIYNEDQNIDTRDMYEKFPEYIKQAEKEFEDTFEPGILEAMPEETRLRLLSNVAAAKYISEKSDDPLLKFKMDEEIGARLGSVGSMMFGGPPLTENDEMLHFTSDENYLKPLDSLFAAMPYKFEQYVEAQDQAADIAMSYARENAPEAFLRVLLAEQQKTFGSVEVPADARARYHQEIHRKLASSYPELLVIDNYHGQNSGHAAAAIFGISSTEIGSTLIQNTPISGKLDDATAAGLYSFLEENIAERSPAELRMSDQYLRFVSPAGMEATILNAFEGRPEDAEKALSIYRRRLRGEEIIVEPAS